MSLPPGPRVPSVVQLVEFTRRPLEWLEACAARHGDPFTMRLPGLGTYVLAAAPELIKQIFTADADVMKAGKANELLRPIVGDRSVIILDGAAHLRQRRLLSPPLRGDRMHAYGALIAAITEAELARMPLGRPCSLHHHLQAITLDVILRAVFGLDEGPGLHELRPLLVAMLEPPPAILAFLPPRWIDVPFSPYRTFLRRRDAVDRALRRIIRARAAEPDRGRADILSLLLAARDEQGVAMTEDELRDELITMLIAGHETTATALSWAFACVLDRPDVEARLRDELSGARTTAGALDLSAVTACDYLDAVVKETLRVRPILPDVARYLEQPVRFAGHDIPAGVNLAPCIHLAHRRREAYPEPARFRPERWLGAKVDPYTWLPFGGGVRRCLGMAFALFEMKVVLAVVLARADVRLATPGPVRVVRRTISLAPAGGTRVIVERRR